MFNEHPRHIGELAMSRQIDHLYRCSTMPPNRWYLFGALEGDVYLRPDGTTEPFDFRLDGDKYREDATWQDAGAVVRLAPDGRIDIASLPIEKPIPAPRRGRAKGK